MCFMHKKPENDGGFMKSWHAESSVPNEKVHVVGFMYI